MLNKLSAVLKSSLLRGTLWTFMGQAMSLVIQAWYFVLIARALGPSAYGAMVTTSAMAMIVTPFVSLGTGALMLKHVSRDAKAFSERFGNALLTTLVSGIVLLALDFSVSRWTLPTSFTWSFILLVFISDVIAFRFMEICRQAFQAVHKMFLSAVVQILSTALRLIAAILMISFHSSPTAVLWAKYYFLSSVLAALAAVIMAWVKIGSPRIKVALITAEIAEGLYFAVAYSALTIYNDIDKTMLGRLSSLRAAGLYGAAYRILEVGYVPIRSLLLTTQPRFFHAGGSGLRGAMGLAKKVLPPAFAYAVFASLLLIIAAPLLPYILGQSYSGSAEALRWLAPIIMLRVIHQTIGDAISGADRQGARTLMMVAIAVLNTVINFWLIPRFGWRGAAWSSILSDGALALMFCIYALFPRHDPDSGTLAAAASGNKPV